MQALERHGRILGWIEIYDDRGNRVALIGGRLVADAADGEPWLSQTPTDALTLLRLALVQRLGTP